MDDLGVPLLQETTTYSYYHRVHLCTIASPPSFAYGFLLAPNERFFLGGHRLTQPVLGDSDA